MGAYRTLLKFIRFRLQWVIGCRGCLLRCRWIWGFVNRDRTCCFSAFLMVQTPRSPCGWRILRMRTPAPRCPGSQLLNSLPPRQNYDTNPSFSPTTNPSPSLSLTKPHYPPSLPVITYSVSLWLTIIYLSSFYFISGWLLWWHFYGSLILLMIHLPFFENLHLCLILMSLLTSVLGAHILSLCTLPPGLTPLKNAFLSSMFYFYFRSSEAYTRLKHAPVALCTHYLLQLSVFCSCSSK